MGPFGVPRPRSEFLPQVFNLDAAGKPIMPNRKALLVHAAVVRDCDMNDGVKDGLIGDPRLCRFDPAELQCKGADIRSCLTPAQVGVVRKIYQGRGAMKGSEFNWIGAYLNNATMPGEALKPIPYLGDGRGDPALVDTLNSPANPDLRPFKARGGKLIMVHGWSDQSVAPLPSVDYYETMTRTMGGRASTIDFARLFMIPGMDHCSGGEGAYAIDYVGALEDWVERGKAPDKLIGFHPAAGAPLDYFSVNLPITDPKYLEFSRPHFAYPAVARYSGKGDPKLAASFVAVNP
jgi:feruloyl esterase